MSLRRCLGAHGGDLFTVRAVETRRLAAGQPAHQRELTAVMDAVQNDHVPENVADRERRAEEGKRAIEIGWRKLFDPGHGVLMHALETGCQRFDLAWPIDVRWTRRHIKVSLLDPEAHVGV